MAQLRKDNSPDDATDSVRFEHGSEYRWDPSFLEGLRRVLAPIHEERLQF